MPSFSSKPSNLNTRVHIKYKNHSPTKNNCLVQSILQLCSQGHLSQALSILDSLVQKGIRLPSRTLAFLLEQCGNSKSLRLGKLVHLHLHLTGFKRPCTFLSNHLINMYFKCGNEVEARKVFDKMTARNLYSWNNMLSGYANLENLVAAKNLFDKMPEKDVVSWNTMAIAYVQNGLCDEGLRFFRELRRLSIEYNEFSFAGVLTACVKLRDLELTRQIHGQVLVTGFLSNVVLSSTIVDAYAKCEQIRDAKRLFDDMQVRDIHAWTTMVSAYARCGNLKSASELFDQMPKKSSVSWTALIGGYARHGMGRDALSLFSKMMMFRIRPDQFTFSSCLCACASIGSLKHGKQIHAFLVRANFRPNTIVVSSLIDMYTKCGNLETAFQVFNFSNNKEDVVLWNTMISAFAQHGRGAKAICMFGNMVSYGVKPNRITFVVLLNACSHSGLLQEGLRIFKTMTSDNGLVLPDQEHYACLIDLLGRAGYFDELMNQLEKMPCKPDDQVWNSLLGVCKIQGNIELGKKAAEHVIESNPQSYSGYLLLSSIYAALGRWESVEKVRQQMEDRHVRKNQATSWIGTDG